MPLNHKALWEAAVMLAEVEEMQLTIKCTLAASTITAVAGCGGFLLLGPAGLFVGSTIAGMGMYGYTKNKFKPVFLILRDDLRPQQQQQLIDLIREGFKDLDYSDAVKILACLMDKQELKMKMLCILKVYLLEYYITGMAKNNVDVELKSKAELAMYGRYTEQYKKQQGLTGMVFPPIEDGGSGWTSAPAPGWRSLVAANGADNAALARNQFSEDARVLSGRVLPQQPIAPMDAPAVDESERPDLPTVPKVLLKTTF